jgi:hypothetical protein
LRLIPSENWITICLDSYARCVAWLVVALTAQVAHAAEPAAAPAGASGQAASNSDGTLQEIVKVGVRGAEEQATRIKRDAALLRNQRLNRGSKYRPSSDPELRATLQFVSALGKYRQLPATLPA